MTYEVNNFFNIVNNIIFMLVINIKYLFILIKLLLFNHKLKKYTYSKIVFINIP
jgi:hypothetical protein